MLILLGFLAVGLGATGCYYGARSAGAFLTRMLDLAERRLILMENATRSASPPRGLPPDLYRRITKWGNADAQEAERKVLLDLYFEFADAADPWVEVRAHLPPEPSDDLPAEMYTQ